MERLAAPRQIAAWHGGDVPSSIRRLTILCIAVTIGMAALGLLVLLDSRNDAWQSAQQASENLSVALERDIARNIQVFDLSLQGAIDALELPGVDDLSPDLRQTALFDRSASAEFLGSVLVLDAAGKVIADSTSTTAHVLDLGDRDYFQVHRTRRDVGLYLSQPFASRLRAGDPSIAISRRRPSENGRFNGVVVGTLRLAYFETLFDKLNLGTGGSVTIFRKDGTVLARHPYRAGDTGRSLKGTEQFERFIAAPAGSVVGRARLDGVERLYTFRHVGDLPLIISLSRSVDDIFKPWWRKAIGLSFILTLLCGATILLCVLLRRELLRRLTAEADLRDTAQKLSILASTDVLTGLANRRVFAAELNQEWRRAIRSELPVAVLMLDVDCFKAYNDQYGHQDGDRVLRMIGACIQGAIRRPGDIAARYGGEEFAILLPETDSDGAHVMAERIRAGIVALGVVHPGNPTGWMTASLGVGVLHPTIGETEDDIVRIADKALYAAKHAGRNCVRGAMGATGPSGARLVTVTPLPLAS